MKRIIIVICLVVLLLLGSFFAFIAFSQPPGKPKVLVSFAGFTNDSSGIRLATFAVSNASTWAVSRGSYYRVELPLEAGWTNFTEGWFAAGGNTLRSGSSEVVAIPAPTNQSSWRVAFSTRKNEGVLMGMATELLIEGQKIGLPTRYTRVGYWVFSNLVEEKP